MIEWQPIETAPKNIDVLVAHGGHVFIARYVPAKTMRANDYFEGWGEYDEADDEYFCPAGWYRRNDCEYCDIGHSDLNENPAHWIPLPKPPSE